MYIDTVATDDMNVQYSYGMEHQVSQWNDKEVQELKERHLPFQLSTYLQGIEPIMSGGNFSGGVSYSEKEGLKVEIKVEAQLGPSKDKDSTGSENANSTPAQPEAPDGHDRDSSE